MHVADPRTELRGGHGRARAPRKPDFLCVGPHKTGTTWLYVMLRDHPDVWLPPKKELWVLNQIGEPYLARWHGYMRGTGMAGDSRRNFFSDVARNRAAGRSLRAMRPLLWWWIKYLVLPYNFITYEHFFLRGSHRLCGDITPNYYYVEERVIAELARRNRDTRILLLLRHPVERVWSYTRMEIESEYHVPFGSISHDQFIEYFDKLHRWWKPYPQQIQMWQKYFGDVFIGYYDALREDPSGFYGDICRFLGIEADEAADAARIVNAGNAERLPHDLLAYLNRQYLDEVRDLAAWSGGGFSSRWLENMQAFDK